MEAESGAKIAIRGKGSVKEGKGRSDAAAMSNLEEDLHCLVTADSEEKVPTSSHHSLLHILMIRLLLRLRLLKGLSRLLHRLQKHKTNSRKINFECSQPSTELSVTTKAKPVKTVPSPSRQLN